MPADRWASVPPVHVVNLKVFVGPSSHVGKRQAHNASQGKIVMTKAF